MTQSMTAFAGTRHEQDGWLMAWEIRTVNHRFLDISLRLPDNLRFLEAEIRTQIAQQIKRGRAECTLTYKKSDQSQAPIEINLALVEQLMAATRTVEALGEDRLCAFDALKVLQWPGVLHQTETDQEVLASQALALLNASLEQLVAGRATEGAQLALLIEERCTRIRQLATVARERLPEVLETLIARTRARLADIAADMDPQRMEQEMVYLAQKLDVAEELDRIETHLNAIAETLARDEPVGRRLDFLIQELNREANTLGSKSADAGMTHNSVEMKVLIEQMKEQIQNIE